jgi:hypothetical protein
MRKSREVQRNLQSDRWQKDYAARLVEFGLFVTSREGHTNLYHIQDQDKVDAIVANEAESGGLELSWLLFPKKVPCPPMFQVEEAAPEEEAPGEDAVDVLERDEEIDDPDDPLTTALEHVFTSIEGLGERIDTLAKELVELGKALSGTVGTQESIDERLTALETNPRQITFTPQTWDDLKSLVAKADPTELSRLSQVIAWHSTRLGQLYGTRLVETANSLKACSEIQEGLADQLMDASKILKESHEPQTPPPRQTIPEAQGRG